MYVCVFARALCSKHSWVLRVVCWVVVARCLACLPACRPSRWLACPPLGWPGLSSLSFLFLASGSLQRRMDLSSQFSLLHFKGKRSPDFHWRSGGTGRHRVRGPHSYMQVAVSRLFACLTFRCTFAVLLISVCLAQFHRGTGHSLPFFKTTALTLRVSFSSFAQFCL